MKMFLRVLVIATTLLVLAPGCGKKQESQPGFNPETAKHPEKIANPAEGIQRGGRPPGMPGPTPTGVTP